MWNPGSESRDLKACDIERPLDFIKKSPETRRRVSVRGVKMIIQGSAVRQISPDG